MWRVRVEWVRRAVIVGVGLVGWAISAPGHAAKWGDAFPGSEGFGSKSLGGRGGEVLIVDSLFDKVANPPEGTLRWALQQRGPRIVIFRIAGTIELVGRLEIREPFVTIAGQTAPGGGITIKDYPIKILTHDVILQGIRVRLGARFLPNSDAFNIASPEATGIMVDHCSFSWSTDEVVGAGDGASRITFSNSVFAEGLDCSIHPEGCHSRGLLMRNGVRQVTLFRNYFAHNEFRNPKLFGDPARLGGTYATFDFYNNVVYDWGFWALAGAGRSRVNVDGNTFQLGPSTHGYPDHLEIISTDEDSGYRLWVDGNVGPSCPTGCDDDWEQMVGGTADEHRSVRRNRTPPAVRVSAGEARSEVLAEVGASYRLDESGQRVPRRDDVDARLVSNFWNVTGGIIDDPAEVGGWPILHPGTPVVDSDLDGMPDTWELANGLDPFDAADAIGNVDGDLYTNVEEYIFESDPAIVDSKPRAARRGGKRLRGRRGEGQSEGATARARQSRRAKAKRLPF